MDSRVVWASGSDGTWLRTTDLFVNFTDADFRLGLHAAQSTLGAIAHLTGAMVKP